MSVQSAGAIIVGGGVVGMSLALMLQRLTEGQQINNQPLVLMAQAALTRQQNQPTRCYTLNQASVGTLASLGVQPEFIPFTEMQVCDLSAGASFCYKAQEFGATSLGYTVGEHKLLQALQDQLASTNIINAAEFAAIERQGHEWQCADTAGCCYMAPLVCAADGSHSQLAQQVGLTERKTWDSGDTAIIANLASDKEYAPVARQWFSHAAGVVALLPDDADSYSLVWSLPDERAQQLMQLGSAAFAAELSAACAGQAGRLTLLTDRAAFPVRTHLATSLVRNGVALTGNGACTIHPLAGQGLNLSLWGLDLFQDCLRSHAVTDKALDSWQARVLVVNLAYWSLMRNLRWTFRSTNPAIAWLRSQLIKQFFCRSLPASLVVDFAMHGIRLKTL